MSNCVYYSHSYIFKEEDICRIFGCNPVSIMNTMYDELHVLAKNFSLISNTTVAIYDTKHNLITSSSNNQPFCSMIRKIPSINNACIKCDILGLSKCSASDKPYLYHCHMGLVEISAPILYGETLLGYILIGQFADDPEKKLFKESITHSSQMTLFPAEEVLAKAEAVAVLDSEHISVLIQLIEMCANYIWLKNLIDLGENTLAYEIRLYISRHLTEDLSIHSLCTKYNISSTTLYQQFKNAFQKSVVEVIREERIKKAKQLLHDTNLPISEIAARVGILDANYFSRTFKSQTGVTPKKYRDQEGEIG